MNSFTIALAVFIALHIGLSATGLRRSAVGVIGEGPYRGLFALASAGALVWMIMGYRALRGDPLDPLNRLLYVPEVWGRHAAQGLVLIGFLFAVTGLLTPGPTTAGMEGMLKKEESAKGILRITRHPFLWGVFFWGLGHLLANGERGAVMLFGGLAVMVLFGTRSIDRKSAARDPEHWAQFAAVTSNVPLAAVVQGRNKLAIGEMWWRLLIAIGAYLGVVWAHGAVFGLPVVP